jgi:hypothetical protein
MMLRKSLVFAALAAMAAGPARAYYVGSVGFPFRQGGNGLEVVYDTGSREIEPSDGGREFDMDTDRLYFQYTRGLGNGLELFGRVMPETGEVEFEDSFFNPEVWGLGGGVRWSPQQKGKLKLGFQAAFDLNQGDDEDVDIDIKELMFVGGGSYRVNRNVDAYGGLSFLKSNITVEWAGYDADYENSGTIGLFGGFDLKPSKNFTVGVELHLINETVFAVTGRFKF